jgi:hypothetical protein
MTNEEFHNLTEKMNLDSGDQIALCFRVAPLMGDPHTQQMAWNFIAATFQSFESGYLVVDTEPGRELIPFEDVMRFIKVSKVEQPSLHRV